MYVPWVIVQEPFYTVDDVVVEVGVSEHRWL